MKKEITFNEKLRKLVFAAMFAALSCAATLVIQIPSPMNGYVNLGDCFVLLSGIYLGSLWGFAAGGIGSMFADIISGYMHYAPGTFLIKGIMALTVAAVYNAIIKAKSKNIKSAAYLISGTISELIMVIGYFAYAAVFLGNGLAAATSIPGNLMQGVFGVVSSYILMNLLDRTKVGNQLREL